MYAIVIPILIDASIHLECQKCVRRVVTNRIEHAICAMSKKHTISHTTNLK